MKDLNEYLMEKINESYLSDDIRYLIDIDELVKNNATGSKEKKVMKAFLNYILDHLDDHDELNNFDDIEKWFQTEAWDDFVQNCKNYKIKDSDIEDIDSIPFENLINDIIETIA